MNKKFIRSLILYILSFVLLLPNTVKAETSYPSELSGRPVSDTIKDQRPIAIMVDNEKKALPHYGVSEADIVYEIMNSTQNDRITRLMCLYKDWGSIPRIGSVRSVRTTHIPLAAEYNAILIHEGGPEIYITEPLKNEWSTDLNGGFSRLKNGKAMEFTEFVLEGEVADHAKKAGVSLSYNEYKPKRLSHFLYSDSVELSRQNNSMSGMNVDLSAGFKHTASKLNYNKEKKKYNYTVYGTLQKDEEDNEEIMFDNVLIQIAPFFELDPNGYLTYQTIGSGNGYYLTGGSCIPVFWQKTDVTAPTRFYLGANDRREINLKKGKTYVALYPQEYEESIVID